MVDSYSKEEVVAPMLSREEGPGVREAEGQTIQPVQTNGSPKQGMEGQSSLPSSTTDQTTSGDRSDWYNRLV